MKKRIEASGYSMEVEIFENRRKEDDTVAFCVQDTLPLPPGAIAYEKDTVSSIARSLTVNLASRGDSGWAWCHATEEFRQALGHMWEENELEKDRWYWVEIGEQTLIESVGTQGEDVLEQLKLTQKALYKACQEVEDRTGSCPLDVHEDSDVIMKWHGDCEEKCGKVDVVKCWEKFYMKKAKNEKE